MELNSIAVILSRMASLLKAPLVHICKSITSSEADKISVDSEANTPGGMGPALGRIIPLL
jgi:hypothetical protein